MMWSKDLVFNRPDEGLRRSRGSSCEQSRDIPEQASTNDRAGVCIFCYWVFESALMCEVSLELRSAFVVTLRQ